MRLAIAKWLTFRTLLSRASLGADALRFLVAGGLNTLLTFLIYQLALFLVSPSLAYGLAWLCGLAFVMVFYPSRVFAQKNTQLRNRLALAATYLIVFFVGLATIDILSRLGMPPRYSIIFAIVVTTVSNFVCGRFLVRREFGLAALKTRTRRPVMTFGKPHPPESGPTPIDHSRE
ncbi:GtrA family protein [Fulvimarina endophytica]|uniref:GtrA family protein n=1 Tax=Fulvimarina endophytica TaxID=2293836 RepID=A0A371X376_9HYPH|nr:GtrA family protein [Fulvimarina endophytica]RFC63649.1 GtrA family protein [Fulvimarina endophytica]